MVKVIQIGRTDHSINIKISTGEPGEGRKQNKSTINQGS